jgi:hypothetical protein
LEQSIDVILPNEGSTEIKLSYNGKALITNNITSAGS